MLGLILIAVGSGGIKPCVSAHVGDQFGSGNAHLLERIFGWFIFPSIWVPLLPLFLLLIFLHTRILVLLGPSVSLVF